MSALPHGVSLTPLKQIRDHRGAVMHVLRADSPLFERFGEVYLSTVKGAVAKGWKRHLLMTQNFAVPVGAVEFAIYDPRESSPTFRQLARVTIGADDYRLLHLPPLLWYAFRGRADGESLIVNCATHMHSPDEVERLPEDQSPTPFAW